MKLFSISQDEFNLSSPSQRVLVHENARRFARVVLTSGWTVLISWRSDLIEPVLCSGKRGEIWMGVDLRITCLGDDGVVRVALGLATPLLGIFCFEGPTVILCETEAIVFNTDHSIQVIKGLQDTPISVTEDRQGRVEVHLADGSKLAIFEKIASDGE